MTVRSVKHVLDAAVEAARWAPSVHNTQPWTFSVSDGEIALRADAERRLRVSDAAGRELLISCGAALFTLRTVLLCEGYEPVVRILPDPDRPSLLATVGPGAETRADEQTWVLGGEIERRRTHRAGFADVPVPDRLVEVLVAAAAAEGATLTPMRSPEAVNVLAVLTQAAQAVQTQDPQFSLEILRWSRRPESARRDGVRAGPALAESQEPHFAQRDYSWRHEWDGRPARRGPAAPGLVALLTTEGDSPADWIAAGQALQRVLLHAAAHGVSAAFHTQALEMPHLREFIREQLCSGAQPQMIMRLGVTFDEEDSVRRPLPDVVD